MTYTYSKAIDSGSEATASGTGDINIFPPEQDDYKRGLSRFDTRHRFTGTGSYRFRSTRRLKTGRARCSAAGRSRASLSSRRARRSRSSTPVRWTSISTASRISVRSSWIPYAGGWTVNNPNTAVSSLPASAFRRATPDDQSTIWSAATRTTRTVSSSRHGLYKTFRAPMGSSVVLRLDVFNVFNHVTWGFPTNDFASVNSAASSARTSTTGGRPSRSERASSFDLPPSRAVFAARDNERYPSSRRRRRISVTPTVPQQRFFAVYAAQNDGVIDSLHAPPLLDPPRPPPHSLRVRFADVVDVR